MAQTVTVTGGVDSGAFNIVTGAATSTDAAYAGLNAADAPVTNASSPGVTVTPTTGTG